MRKHFCSGYKEWQTRERQKNSPSSLTNKRFTWYFENKLFCNRIVIIITMVAHVTNSRSKWELLGDGSASVAAEKDLVNPNSFGELQGQIE